MEKDQVGKDGDITRLLSPHVYIDLSPCTQTGTRHAMPSSRSTYANRTHAKGLCTCIFNRKKPYDLSVYFHLLGWSRVYREFEEPHNALTCKQHLSPETHNFLVECGPFLPARGALRYFYGPSFFFVNSDLHIHFGPCRWSPKDFLVKLTKSCAPHRSPRALPRHGALS